MSVLEFGIPKDSSQAIIRLPTRNHPLYESDEVIEHLTHIGEELIKLSVLNTLERKYFQELMLEDRLIPLALNDLTFLERISFKRSQTPIATAEHEYIERGSAWGEFYFQNDDDYGWWEVYLMTPNLEVPNHKLVCIMFNKYIGGCGFPPQRNRLDENNWDIEMGLVKDDELSLLVQLLNRNKQPN